MRTRMLSLMGGICLLALAGLIFGHGAFSVRADTGTVDEPAYAADAEASPDLAGYEFEALTDEPSADGMVDFFVAVPPEAVGGWVDLYEETDAGTELLASTPIYEPVFLISGSTLLDAPILLEVASPLGDIHDLGPTVPVVLRKKPPVDPEMR